MTIEKRIILWTIAICAALLICIPSVEIYRTFHKYFGFLESWEVSARIAGKHPSRAGASIQQAKPSPPEFRFVKFSVSAPGAKVVRLTANFNRWKPDALSLLQVRKGKWEVVVPLPPGKYEYAFLIDGVWTIDSLNTRTGYYGERQTSVIIVE